jgi:serine/threonine-protein kinase RsbT
VRLKGLPVASVNASGELPLMDAADIVRGRSVVRRLSSELGFTLLNQTKIVTATSELARNTVIHGKGGVLQWEVLKRGTRQGLRITFHDHGPGISDIELALSNGWSSGRGMGLGLPGARRLVHEFALESAVGAGTRVSITCWRDAPSPRF